MDQILLYKLRVTTPFLAAIPAAVKHFDAYIYTVVRRRVGHDIPDHEWGTDVRLDPCVLDWETKTITIRIPLDINYGITSIDDLDPDFYEDVEAAFLLLMHNCI